MKKATLIVSFLVMATLLLTACGEKTDTQACGGKHKTGLPNLKGQAISVAVENAYPPFNMINEQTAKGEGWDYDTVCEICNRINCKPEFKQAAWDGIFLAMAAGEYDMLADGVTFTAERDETVDFSTPYVVVDQALMVRATDTFTLDAFQADATKLVGTQIGTTNAIAAKRIYGENRVQEFEDFGAATLALLAGDIDGVVVDLYVAKGYMRENEGKLKVAGIVSSDDQLAFVFPPGSDLIASVNAALKSMMDDGKLKELNKKWELSQ
jgi:polar amino acid transport system substrate-binding protein